MKEKEGNLNLANKFHSLGIYYFIDGKYQKAIEFFKKVLIINPEHKDSKDKIKLLIKKLKKKNYLNEKYYCIIDGYLINNKIVNLRKKFGYKSYYKLGIYYKNILLYDKAIKAFKNVLKIKPNHTPTYYELGNIYDEIENYYEYANDYYNGNLFNINTLIYNNDCEEVYPKLTLSIKLNKADLYYKLTGAIKDPKYYHQVIELCNRAINIEPDFTDPYFWIGWIYEKLKDYKNAEYFYKKAMYADENHSHVYNRLGNIYMKQLNFKEALKIYKESLIDNPENIQAYLRVGFIYNKILQYDKAIEILKKAIRIEPQNFFLYHLISKSYKKLGQHVAEKDALKKAIDIKPDYFKAYKDLWCLYNDQKMEKNILSENNKTKKNEIFEKIKYIIIVIQEKARLFFKKMKRIF
jgi:superkiller protein 3